MRRAAESHEGGPFSVRGSTVGFVHAIMVFKIIFIDGHVVWQLVVRVFMIAVCGHRGHGRTKALCVARGGEGGRTNCLSIVIPIVFAHISFLCG